MTREAEVKDNIQTLTKDIKEIQKLPLTEEQVTNINLSAIAQQLSDISITLAMIVDRLDKEEEECKEH